MSGAAGYEVAIFGADDIEADVTSGRLMFLGSPEGRTVSDALRLHIFDLMPDAIDYSVAPLSTTQVKSISSIQTRIPIFAVSCVPSLLKAPVTYADPTLIEPYGKALKTYGFIDATSSCGVDGKFWAGITIKNDHE